MFLPLEVKPPGIEGTVLQSLRYGLDMTCEQSHELIHAYIDGELDLLRNEKSSATSTNVKRAARNIRISCICDR
jgi:hypothetical protein